MDELQAALLRVKLKKLDEWNVERRKLADRYLLKLKEVDEVTLPQTAENAKHVYHIFPILHPERDRLQERLRDHEIGTLIHYPIPPHLQKAYAELNYKKGDFPIAERIAKTELSLPLWPGMQLSDVDRVCGVISDH